jgi:hypothetical protein
MFDAGRIERQPGRPRSPIISARLVAARQVWIDFLDVTNEIIN